MRISSRKPMTEPGCFNSPSNINSVTESASGLAHLPASHLFVEDSIARSPNFVKQSRCTSWYRKLLAQIICIQLRIPGSINVISGYPPLSGIYPHFHKMSRSPFGRTGMVSLLGAKNTVARIAQPGNNIGVFIQFLVHSRHVDFHIGVVLLNTGNSFRGS